MKTKNLETKKNIKGITLIVLVLDAPKGSDSLGSPKGARPLFCPFRALGFSAPSGRPRGSGAPSGGPEGDTLKG